MAEWSREEINSLDINVRLRNMQLETDLHIKPTDIHQSLDSTSCHPYHCKKSIPDSQALQYNRICSDNEKFDQRCNDLEKWLIERGCSERLVGAQILKTRDEPRDSFLERGNTRTSERYLLLTALTTQCFRMSEACCRNFKVW